MSQIPNLDNSPLNLKSLRDQSQKELVNILNNIRGKKCLVVDKKLSGSISLIIQTSILVELGVELRLLSPEPLQTECIKVVYLVRSDLNLMRFICSHIHSDVSKAIQREYHIYFVPHRGVDCEKVLEDENVHHLITIGEYPLYMVPVDEDVLSFELEYSSKECLVDGTTSSLWHIAKALHKLEFSFGVIPNLRAKGKASVRVVDILNRMQAEEPVNASDRSTPEINTLVLIDREVDMVTPMCSQLTYEGLLDEFLHINNGSIELDSSIMGIQEPKKMKIPLNSSDKLLKEIRDLNFEVVVQVLRQKATAMKQDYTDMSTTDQSVSELKDFVRKLNSLPEMTRHINLAQHLSTFTSKQSFLGKLDIEHTIIEAQNYDMCIEYIEEMIHKQESLVGVLRLLILLSVTNSGLNKRHFDYLRRELLHSYGFEHLAVLYNLEKAGLLKKQEAKSNSWLAIKRNLRLVVEDTDTANPNDVIAYVFSGYAPLSIRLVQQAIRSGWRSVEETLKLLPGPHLETRRRGFSSSPSYGTLQAALPNVERLVDGRRLVIVVFIGGVTLAEISALRFLSAQEGMAYDLALLVATTKIINGNTLIETFMENLG